MFPSVNPINQFIYVQGDSTTYSYKVVGVISPNYSLKKDILNAKKNLKSNTKALYIETCIYIPNSVWEEDLKNENGDGLLLWTDINEQEKTQIENSIKNYLNTNYSDNIIDKKIEKQKIENELNSYKYLFILFSILVFLFSGLNSMNIFFFSIKERVEEIGIRKAYGATKENIMMQFILESLIVSLIATLFALVVALILMIKTIPIASDYLGIILHVKLKINLFILPFLVASFQGICFSIIPSIYASSIKVVDALRFE